jgi:hypothetical protein
MWTGHDVQVTTSGTLRYRHPATGDLDLDLDLDLDHQTRAVNGTDGQVLHVFSAEPVTPSADGLTLLLHPFGAISS